MYSSQSLSMIQGIHPSSSTMMMMAMMKNNNRQNVMNNNNYQVGIMNNNINLRVVGMMNPQQQQGSTITMMQSNTLPHTLPPTRPTPTAVTTTSPNIIYQLRERDVICGRNKMARLHTGNKYFRTIVSQYSMVYQTSITRIEKSRITHQVIDVIKKHGGRFLMVTSSSDTTTDDDNKKLTYELASYDYVYEKVSHALRSSKFATPKPTKKMNVIKKIDGMKKIEEMKKIDDMKKHDEIKKAAVVFPAPLQQQALPPPQQPLRPPQQQPTLPQPAATKPPTPTRAAATAADCSFLMKQYNEEVRRSNTMLDAYLRDIPQHTTTTTVGNTGLKQQQPQQNLNFPTKQNQQQQKKQSSIGYSEYLLQERMQKPIRRPSITTTTKVPQQKKKKYTRTSPKTVSTDDEQVRIVSPPETPENATCNKQSLSLEKMKLLLERNPSLLVPPEKKKKLVPPTATATTIESTNSFDGSSSTTSSLSIFGRDEQTLLLQSDIGNIEFDDDDNDDLIIDDDDSIIHQICSEVDDEDNNILDTSFDNVCTNFLSQMS